MVLTGCPATGVGCCANGVEGVRERPNFTGGAWTPVVMLDRRTRADQLQEASTVDEHTADARGPLRPARAEG
ncbi:hypothetical protein [Umezawaea tangerina]|uniref:hypothetical protein n=1 Tax=Umezawaea tangerina TaxID=84725 RepID=UPI0011B28BCB|nr:hypothetical protein [Umezawaea tangerina]